MDSAVARVAGRLKRLTEQRGRPRTLEDLLIALTALAVLNPFE